MLVDGFNLFIRSHQVEGSVGTQRDGCCAVCANKCRWKVLRLQCRNDFVPSASTLLDEVCKAKRFTEVRITSCRSRINKPLRVDQRSTRIRYFDAVTENLNGQVLTTLF